MLENKGVIKDTNRDVDLIKIDKENKKSIGIPARKVGTPGFLRLFRKNNKVMALFITSDGELFIHEMIYVANIGATDDGEPHEPIKRDNYESIISKIRPDKWRQAASTENVHLRESDIRSRIKLRGFVYNPADVENRINSKANASRYHEFFKRDEENRVERGHNLSLPIVHTTQYGIYLVKDYKPNTSYAIYYKTPQSYKTSIFMHMYRSGNDTPIFVGNFHNVDHQDTNLVSSFHGPGFIGSAGVKDLMTYSNVEWRHMGTFPDNHGIYINTSARDVYINPNAQLSGLYGPRNFPAFYWPLRNMVYNNRYLEIILNGNYLVPRYIRFAYTHERVRSRRHQDRDDTIFFDATGDRSFSVWWRGDIQL